MAGACLYSRCIYCFCWAPQLSLLRVRVSTPFGHYAPGAATSRLRSSNCITRCCSFQNTTWPLSNLAKPNRPFCRLVYAFAPGLPTHTDQPHTHTHHTGHTHIATHIEPHTLPQTHSTQPRPHSPPHSHTHSHTRSQTHSHTHIAHPHTIQTAHPNSPTTAPHTAPRSATHSAPQPHTSPHRHAAFEAAALSAPTQSVFKA